VGNSSISGDFSYENEDFVLESVGNITLKVIFTPDDEENYSKKEINVETIVEKRKISVVFDRLLYKQYDGTKNIELPSFTYSGILNNEVTISGTLVAELDGAYVSNEIGVTLKGITVIGEKKDFYYIESNEHTARIFPSSLEKQGENKTIIFLSEGIYIDINSSLKVISQDNNSKIDKNYTALKEYKYEIYSDEKVNDINSNIEVIMNVSDSLMKTRRLAIYELTQDGVYKELEYNYSNGVMKFSINNNSKIVFATRNIEYGLIFIFSGVLLFYFIFMIIYRCKNSKIKEY
jgi:hypothetical protein